MDEQRSTALSNPADASRPTDLRLKNIAWTAVFAALLLAGFASYGVARFGSIDALVAVLRGRVLYLEPARISLGSLKPREQVNILVRLRNLASKPIKILGSYTPCGCLVAKELPLELAPGEVREVPIHFTVPAGGAAEFEIVVSFYANVAGEQPQLVLHGRILASDLTSGNSKSEG